MNQTFFDKIAFGILKVAIYIAFLPLATGLLSLLFAMMNGGRVALFTSAVFFPFACRQTMHMLTDKQFNEAFELREQLRRKLS